MTRAILVVGLFVAVPALAQDKQCVSNYGQIACGFDCLASYGKVKCAHTPAGVCLANYGKLVCWDPPY